jgi:hypothetical protein
MKENLKLTWFLTIFIPAFLFADRAPQDTWYLDRELKLPEMPGMNKPWGIDFDESGRIFVANKSNHSVGIWNQNGESIMNWATSGSGDGQLSSPTDVAVYGSEVYVTEEGNHRVQVFDLNGTFLRKWGGYGSGDGKFQYPRSLALDINNSSVFEVYVTDWNQHKIQVFDSNGTFKRSFGGNVGGDAGIAHPAGVAIGPDDLVYVSSRNHSKIKVFETNGTYVRSFNTNGHPYHLDFHGDELAVSLYDHHKTQVFDKNGTLKFTLGTSASSQPGLFYHNVGIAFNSAGRLFVGCSHNHRIQEFESNGSYLKSIGFYGVPNFAPYDFEITPEDSYLITDISGHRVFELDENGSFIRIIATNGSGDGQVNAPRSVHLGTDNRIYVADTGSHRVQIFDRNGTFIRKFGSSGSGDGQFNQPYGVVTSNTGEIFVVDRYNHRVQAFDSNGTFLRKFGSNGSLEGQMNQPHDITISDQGNLMVADFYNRRIVHFTTAGEFLKLPHRE